MDKKSKEALRRYKKARKAAESSSESSSSSSDSESGSSSSYSSEDERRHRHKKSRQPGMRRSSSSSGDERHKREKERRCQKKLEAKRNHLKRKLKEAKLKKKAAAAAAALSGHSHRALSPATQAKLKKLAERKHLRAASKERREREKEKHRALREREREHHHRSSRSPTKITKIRIHQDVNRQKTPPRVHHQLMSREKIIIQTRTRDRTPSAERERLRHEKMRHEDMARERERREREAARDKERAEALARCQERQRERERLAREKLRREEEEKYGKPMSERLLARGPEREMGGRGFEPRDRSLERTKRDIDPYDHGYGRKHRPDDYDEESERRAILEREELLREREYLARRREMSPSEYPGSSGSRMRADPRDIYPEDDRERAYKRPFIEEGRGGGGGREPWLSEREIRAREMHDPRDYREMEPDHLYPEERDRLPPPRERERGYVGRPGSDWKRKEWVGSPREWPNDEPGPSHASGRGFGGPKRGTGSVLPPGKIPPPSAREPRPQSETDWDAEEGQIEVSKKPESGRDAWLEHDKRDLPEAREKLAPGGRPWDWRERDEPSGPPSYSRGPPGPMIHHPRSERGGRGGYRRGGHIIHGERAPGIHGFRAHHPPALLNLPPSGGGGGGSFHEGSPRFPNKRNMTYTNPNILKKQQAALAAANTAVAAAKAAAQSAASGTTNPSILGQAAGAARPGQSADDKPEAGEIVGEAEEKQTAVSNAAEGAPEQSEQPSGETPPEKEKKSGELSEISDSDDDILNKTEKKAKLDNEDSNSQTKTEDKEATEEKGEEEEIMDFEEISDGELEEERAAKGVGDALGVDWSSLVAETKREPTCATTTAKQKWQPHRIILDIGISMRMAGEEYAKELLNNAKQQLEEEMKEESSSNIKSEVKDETTIKSEIKDEVSSLSTLDEDSQTAVENDENTSDIKPKEEKPDVKPPPTETINIDSLPPLACMQVAQRKLQMERNNLIANACGLNSRALSARQDLKLRRQLCGLPARECPISRNIPVTSDKLKAMALAAFQRTLEVK
ncbi:fl(2)d-associated complex component-like [Musca vetustissima]|uniref:fl(2)d-associated complex component-like n=1 Tax=Musca vetustissima TaxID=27455 RepID=UPI002AB66400|nr:fl(2)d-associated complex component-like [Musca vetustissima]